MPTTREPPWPRSRREARPEAKAAFILACALCLFHFQGGEGEPALDPGDQLSCGAPGDIAAARGWTTQVRCDGAGETAPLRGPVRLLFDLPIDLNRADARTLEVLPRIGPARAAAIVEARREAPFASLEDLGRIRGIGPATLAGLLGLAEVGPAAQVRR